MKRVNVAAFVLMWMRKRNVEWTMTPNCGIRRTVCVSVGTPKSAVLGFILTRKHASKYINCFSLLLLLALQLYFIPCLIETQNC
jgi:hypothetical protein